MRRWQMLFSVLAALSISVGGSGCNSVSKTVQENGEGNSEVLCQPATKCVVEDPFADENIRDEAAINARARALAHYAYAQKLLAENDQDGFLNELYATANEDLANEDLVIQVVDALIQRQPEIENETDSADTEDIRRALELIKKSAARKNASARIYDTKAVLEAGFAQYKEAKKSVKKAIRLDPDDIRGRVLMLMFPEEEVTSKECLKIWEEVKKIADKNLRDCIFVLGENTGAKAKLAELGVDVDSDEEELLSKAYELAEAPDVNPDELKLLAKYLAQKAEQTKDKELVDELCDKALGYVQRAAEKLPEDIELVFLKASLFIYTGDAEKLNEAEGMLKPLILTENGGMNLAAIVKLAEIYEKLGDFGKAADFYYYAASITNNIDFLIQCGANHIQNQAPNTALQIFQIISNSGFSNPHLDYLYALAYRQQGNYDEAVNHIKVVYDAAKESGQKLESLEPSFVMIFDILMSSYAKAGDVLAAVGMAFEAQVATSFDCKDELSRGLLLSSANCYDILGMTEKSIQITEKLLANNPDDMTFLNSLAYMYAEMGVKLPEALQYINRAVEMLEKQDNGEGLAALYDTQAWVLYKMGKYDEALVPMLKVLDKLPKKAFENNAIAEYQEEMVVYYDHLGDIYFAKGEKEKALECWQNALKRRTYDKDVLEAIEKKCAQ